MGENLSHWEQGEPAAGGESGNLSPNLSHPCLPILEK
jgi:hypothetical protein